MIGRLFDKFIEWSLNRQEAYLMKKTPIKRKVSRVRRKANAKRKETKK
jgi:hypothetical protein